MSPGNTVQPVVKSTQDACVEQPYPVTVHCCTRRHTLAGTEAPEDVLKTPR